MGRVPCCERENVKRGQWTPEEDNKLSSYIAQHGTRNWRLIPKNAGLQRCGKSCRLRWTNYLRPDLKHGEFSESEEQTIVKLHAVVGSRWSLIAGQLPGRTDNDVKNHWNTKLKKMLSGMGIDHVTHKPFSHLIAEIATTLAPPQVAHIAEAALGCFKDEMLHLLTKKRIDFPTDNAALANMNAYTTTTTASVAESIKEETETIEKIKLGLSKAIMQQQDTSSDDDDDDKVWTTAVMGSAGDQPAADQGGCGGSGLARLGGEVYPALIRDGFRYNIGASSYAINEGEGSAWSQSACTAGAGVVARYGGGLHDHRGEDDEGEKAEGGKTAQNGDDAAGMFSSEWVLWDLPDELMIHPIV